MGRGGSRPGAAFKGTSTLWAANLAFLASSLSGPRERLRGLFLVDDPQAGTLGISQPPNPGICCTLSGWHWEASENEVVDACMA